MCVLFEMKESIVFLCVDSWKTVHLLLVVLYQDSKLSDMFFANIIFQFYFLVEEIKIKSPPLFMPVEKLNIERPPPSLTIVELDDVSI